MLSPRRCVIARIDNKYSGVINFGKVIAGQLGRSKSLSRTELNELFEVHFGLGNFLRRSAFCKHAIEGVPGEAQLQQWAAILGGSAAVRFDSPEAQLNGCRCGRE